MITGPHSKQQELMKEGGKPIVLRYKVTGSVVVSTLFLATIL